MRSLILEERGSALVTVVLVLPVLLGFAALVLDVANWFEHKRHLQLQADAAALAAAGDVRYPCSDGPIISRANEYGGGTWNPQVAGGQSRTHLLVNSSTYYGQSSASDRTLRAGGPCASSQIDVKLTESNVPRLFGAFAATVNAHARVDILQADTFTGVIPVAVPDVAPKRVRATFVNEDTGAALGVADLIRDGNAANGNAIWDNANTPAAVTVASGVAHVGVRVALSGSNSSVSCGDALVECYDAGGTGGVGFIRGWDGTGSGAQPGAPRARDVSLYAGSCPAAYVTTSTTSCTVGVRATVDFGTNNPPGSLGASVTATVNGTNYPLTYDPSAGTWDSGTSVSVPPGAGPLPVTLTWTETKGTQAGNSCRTGSGNKCTGPLAGGTQQRVFSTSSDRSGPIAALEVDEGARLNANSFRQCDAGFTSCTHNLTVRLTLQGSLSDAQTVSDPIVRLRVVGGSQNQSLDCDPNISAFKDELWKGCGPSYTRNTGTACPSTPGALWSSAQPWSCVAVQTGTSRNDISAGMNHRILGSEKPTTCTAPNHWSSFPNISRDDPRIVHLVLTPYGTFAGSGSTTVPVTDFATFYVTGWGSNGSGFDNPCAGRGDDPVPDGGYLVGHFIKYIQVPNLGSGGNTPCSSAALGTCVAVLTQ